MKRSTILLSVWILGLLLSGCGGEKQTPEARIRALIGAGEAAVESRDLSRVLELISEDYRDDRGLDLQEVKRIIAGQFLIHQSIHLLVQTEEIRLLSPTRAQALTYVAMSGASIDSPDDLLGLRADLYRFDLELEIEDDDWRITGGQWRRATVADFFR